MKLGLSTDGEGDPAEPHSVLERLHVILDEDWEHGRCASGDLGILEARLRWRLLQAMWDSY